MNHEQLSHLHAAYRAYALLPANERIQWIRQDRWIHFQPYGRDLLKRSDPCRGYESRLENLYPTLLAAITAHATQSAKSD